MNNKFAALTALLSIVLTGCGGSSSSDEGEIIVLGERYQEKPSDVFTTSTTTNITFSDGRTSETSFTDVDIYSLVSVIPPKYAYSLTTSGSFLLKTSKEDDVLNGLEYMTESGDSIIDDDLEYFKNVEHTTKSGSEKPENIHIGDKLNFSQNATLFNSQTGVNEGYETINMDFTVLNEEQITVPAGSFNAIKVGYSASSTTSKNNIVNTVSATGNLWLDTTNAYGLKSTSDGTLTLNEQNLTATFSTVSTLQSYTIAQNKPSEKGLGTRARKALSHIDLSPSLIIQSIKKNIKSVR